MRIHHFRVTTIRPKVSNNYDNQLKSLASKRPKGKIIQISPYPSKLKMDTTTGWLVTWRKLPQGLMGKIPSACLCVRSSEAHALSPSMGIGHPWFFKIWIIFVRYFQIDFSLLSTTFCLIFSHISQQHKLWYHLLRKLLKKSWSRLKKPTKWIPQPPKLDQQPPCTLAAIFTLIGRFLFSTHKWYKVVTIIGKKGWTTTIEPLKFAPKPTALFTPSFHCNQPTKKDKEHVWYDLKPN